jgi:hypothetical protein
MKSRKITEGDVADKKVASLPTRPTAPTAFGGKGYTPTELKEAFDKLALYVIERYNELIEAIGALGEESIAAAIKTGIEEEHTLSDMFSDIGSGSFPSYVKILDTTLLEYLLSLREDIDKIKSALSIN